MRWLARNTVVIVGTIYSNISGTLIREMLRKGKRPDEIIYAA
jgi:ATP sulfurylase